jgi:serine protease Do
MNKPFDPCPTSRIALPAPDTRAATPKGSFYTGDVKNRQRSSSVAPATSPSRRLALTAATALSLFLTALAPAAAFAGDVPGKPALPPRKPDPTLSGFKKLQDVVNNAQAERAAKDKAAKDKAGKDKDKNAKKEPTLEEKAQRGVVIIERGGQQVGLGAVLAGDGRVITALSPLGSGNDLEARFSDGSTVRVKLGHHDRMWDLALLVPQTGKWQDGLTASSRDPVREDATIKSFSGSRGKQPAVSSMTLRGYRTLLGGDDKSLDHAIEIGSRVNPNDLGSPIIDEEARVVAIVGRACAPNEGRPCTPVAFGIPMQAIKGFLRAVPASAVPPPPFLGVQAVADSNSIVKGVRINVVHPGSPAEAAQLKGGDKATGDIILAVDGVPVISADALADAIRSHSVGEKIPLMIFSQGKYKQVIVELRAAPGSQLSPDALAHPAELPPLPDAPQPPPLPPPSGLKPGVRH